MAHPEDIKSACMAALLAGQGVSEVAAEYNIPRTTVQDWKGEIDAGKVGTKKSRIESLVLKLLETNLETLQLQSKFFQREDWLAKQDAAGAAVLHGVVTDKSVRLLEALERGASSQEPPAESP